MKTMGAAKFKAECLAVLDEVEQKREPVLVTKHGRPVAKMVPLEPEAEEDPLDRFRIPGLTIIGDTTSPLYTDEEWEEFFEASAAQLNGTRCHECGDLDAG